ncbi:MAG: cytochrome c [Verrucomicrobiales bacterium]|nr:cytochrome c [Verrucomicrobiales bacterium]
MRACAPCHGKDGKANTPQGRKLGVKDMTQSQLSEPEIRRQILDGKTGPDGAIKMPAFRQTLKEDEVDALARFAKGLQVRPKAPAPKE